MSERKAYTVAIGNAPMPWHPKKIRKMAKEALDYIQSLDGFIGFHPVYPRGTLCLFVTENDAIRAKNLMVFKGIETGTNICECFIDEMYFPKEENADDQEQW